MFGGSNHYINQEVTVHSRVNTETPVQIGSFRLIDISTDGDKISLTMTAHRPWDFITFPQTKTTDSKVPVPVSYGAFTASSNSYYDDTVSSHDLTDTLFDHELTNTDVRPCPLNNATDNNIFFVSDLTAKADSRAEHWDSGLQKFLPINDEDDSAITTSVSNDGQYCTKSEIELKRAIKLRPSTVTVSANDDSITNSDLADIVDSDGDWLTSYATLGSYTASGSTDSIDLEFTDIQVPQGEITQAKLYVTSELTENGLSGSGGQHLRMKTSVDGSSFSTLWTQVGYHVNPTLAWLTRAKTTDSTSISSFPSSLKIRAEWSAAGEGNSMRGTFRIYNVMIVAEYKSRDDQTKTVYIGADGLTHGITGLSGAITEIHEAHLDMLNRFTGLDVATNPATNIDGWSDLNTARSGWDIRWWTLEEIELKKSLEKLQYEGCFIFRYKADGSPQYIHIPDSPSVDHSLTKNDIKGFSVKHTPFSELLTKMELSYEKHPADNRYITTKTAYADTARTNWAIQAKENIKQVKLDAYVSPAITEYDNSTDVASSSPNDDFFAYYYNIFGDIKIQVSGTIVNPDFYRMEVGDIVDFSSMHPTKAFGESWSGKNFMITGLTRSVGTLKFEAREI